MKRGFKVYCIAEQAYTSVILIVVMSGSHKMKIIKIVTILLLAVANCGARAEWVKVVSGKSDTVYADLSSIRKMKDSKVRMWHLLDYNSTQQFSESVPYRSMKRRTEFDCKKPQYRFLYTLYFSKNMAAGDVIGRESKSSKWESLPLITSAESLRKIACGKK
jgi:hypothetical protein